MKTVEQLAKECELINSEGEQLVYEYNNEYLNAIEAFVKAYMQDRLENLEPVAWKYRYIDDGDFQVSLSPTCEADLSWLKQTYKDFEINELHDISSLKGLK